ncbi:MAG: hypothetical protein Kow0060_17960 [Methylohalobius crimeensis]
MQAVIRINFYISVLISVVGGLFVLLKPGLVFPEMMQIYGPLGRNLLVIVFYLVAIQFLLWMFRYHHKDYLEALFMGALFLLAAAGIPFYSRINGIPLSVPLVIGLTYCGVSHLLYFGDTYMRTRKSSKGGNPPF